MQMPEMNIEKRGEAMLLWILQRLFLCNLCQGLTGEWRDV
jgi:hypothetical protein